MADASNCLPDGITSIEPGKGTSELTSHKDFYSPSQPLLDGTSLFTPSVATPSAKRGNMDGDRDGAPSSLETSPKRQKDERHIEIGDGGSAVSFSGSAESTPRGGKPESSSSHSGTGRPGEADLSHVDMKASWDGSAGGGSAKAGMLADPLKIAKEREKEERVRQARERLAEERKRKLEELKEQQRIAQENREKQLEMRRKKIEDLRRKDVERRAAVEERRRIKEESEKVRRESILQKAEERVARYEAWKAGGRKGMFGEGSTTPKHLSVSTSVLYHKRNPEFSSMNVLSPALRPERTLGGNPSSPATPGGHPYHYYRPSPGLHGGPAGLGGSPHGRASMTASMPSPVRMRDKGGPRKQRPASVASSMPSFVGGEPAKSPRSRSTDRTSRDRSKTRPARREDKAGKDKENQGKTPTPGSTPREEKKDHEKKGGRVSLSIFDRLATPKFQKGSAEPSTQDKPAKKDSPIIRLSPRKAYSTTNLATMRKRSSLREKPTPPKDSAPKNNQSKEPAAHAGGPHGGPAHSVKAGSAASARSSSPAPPPSGGGKSSNSSTPRVTPTPSATSTPTATPTHSATPMAASTDKHQTTEDGTATPRGGQAQDITAEEYKARLAEKRRQAREKADREAEEERKRQEEARLAEEQRRLEEEEEQRRQEEETLRLAAEARMAEEERLQRAIEAEEKRRREEDERLEQERKAKEEAERKAKEESEKLEKEKQEKARRDEEERLQRKKKLEMIMKRVKPTDSGASDSSSLKVESPTKSVSPTPTGIPGEMSHGSDAAPVEEMSSSLSGFGVKETISSSPAVEESEEVTSSVAVGTSRVEKSESVSPGASLITHTNALSSGVVRSASSGDILDLPADREEGEQLENDSGNLAHSEVMTPSKPEAGSNISVEAFSEGKPKFKSPLLQQLVENKGGDTSPSSSSSSPKFKSPLLQNLLGKTKVGARMGLSSSMGDLSLNRAAAAADGGDTPANTTSDAKSAIITSTSTTTSTTSNASSLSSLTLSQVLPGEVDFSKEISKQGKDEDKDEDTSEWGDNGTSGRYTRSFITTDNSHPDHSPVTNGIHQNSGGVGLIMTTTTTTTSTCQELSSLSPAETTGGLGLKSPASVMADSALGSSIEPQLEGESSRSPSSVFNGHGVGHTEGHTEHHGNGMGDSSISLRSVEESETSRDRARVEDPAFEEYMDLIDTGDKGNTIVATAPRLAFDENRITDVTESLS